MDWTLAPFTIYLGVKGKMDNLHHHNYFLGQNFNEYASEIFKMSVNPDKPYYAAIRHMTLKVKPDNVEEVINKAKELNIVTEEDLFRVSGLEKRMGVIFNKIFNKTVEEAKDNGFRGYVEGEFIKTDLEIPYKQVDEKQFNTLFGKDSKGLKCKDDNFSLPMLISKRGLKGEAEGEGFRKGEIHITMDGDKSDNRIVNLLEEIGLSRTVIPKQLVDKDGNELKDSQGKPLIKNDAIFTIQGASVSQLDSLFVELVSVINKVGGAHSCTMKLEHVPKYYVSEGVELLKPDSDVNIHGVPPVIDEIKYKDSSMGKTFPNLKDLQTIDGILTKKPSSISK
jgi:hypothetical protein